jgi:hypothetical protein
MLGRLFRWALLLYLLGIGWQAGPIYWHRHQLEQRAVQIAKAGAGQDLDQVGDQVFAAAQALHVPLSREAIAVRRGRGGPKGYVEIDASYVERLQWMPSRSYDWKLSVKVDSRQPTL